ncbi:MAG: helix-turn-helix domain-containing protein [Anaerolineales bacterium]|nr:helix-turn-helix domain-containing protein [Anaerolineales bacterium]
MNIIGMSDKAIIKEIGRRVKRRRLEGNFTQQEIADMAGISRPTVSDLERGKPFGILTLIQILRALNALDSVDAFLPDPGISPLQLAKMRGAERQRASS